MIYNINREEKVWHPNLYALVPPFLSLSIPGLNSDKLVQIYNI